MPRTVKAAEFKQTCLALMDEVERGGEPIVITKRGKPVAKTSTSLIAGITDEDKEGKDLHRLDESHSNSRQAIAQTVCFVRRTSRALQEEQDTLVL
jgi:antitoxin (DNA-binding transcriptional repressor) of toxin-antitoxin stability system